TRTYKTPGPTTCACDHYQTADGRAVIRVPQSHLAKRELQRIMAEPGHRELYRRRKYTAEPPFGQIKAGMGFRRFLYRGREKVGSEWNLVCAAFNVKKLAALLGTRGHPANPGPAPGDEGGNGPFRKLPSITPFFASRGGLLARLTPWVRPRAISVAPLAHSV
ncbi:MAG: transposase, partial [Chloroflexi bacterium]|nr:transposase [Chloroflexota bacterium]